MNTIVDLNDLEKIFSSLLLRLKESKGSAVVLKNDYFWDISTKDIYDPYKTPEDITLGQLSDDILELKRLLEGEDAIVYDFIRVSNIIKAIAIENPIAF